MVVVAVVAGLAALAVLVLGIGWFLRRTSQRARDELAAAHPEALVGPDPVQYRGGTGDYPRVRTTGWLVLTPDALVMRPLTGTTVTVPRGRITGTRVDNAFSTHRNGKPVLVVQTRQGDVGLTVADLPTWEAALRR